MKSQVKNRLKEINREFYQKQAEEFSETRSRPWQGWRRVKEIVEEQISKDVIDVLDIGCGNGRFGRFIEKSDNALINYVGVDSSKELVVIASEVSDKFRVFEFDVVDGDLQNFLRKTGFDVVVAFGLMHHIPGRDERLKLLAQWSKLLSEDGLMAVSFWQFDQDEKIVKRTLSEEDVAKTLDVQQESSGLEKGDYLMCWGGNKKNIRYCHSFSDEEVKRLIEELALELVEEYQADGNNCKLNKYVVLRKK